MVDFRALGAELSNWGRWGPDDEKGTTNLITPDRVRAASRLVRRGRSFDLGIPVDSQGPQVGGARINPVHTMSATGAGQSFPGGFRYADDYIFMPLQSGTQWDGLAHVFYDDRLYNDVDAATVTPKGAARLGIEQQASGVVGRGVLLDIAALHRVEWLEGGTVITPADLDAAAREQGVELEPGDILCVRTGWRRMYLERNSPTEFMGSEPGLGLACCAWLHEHDVAVVCSDNYAIEVVPSEIPDVMLPVHLVLIRDMGMTLGEIFDFEALATDCHTDGTWEFLFCGPPLKITGGVGSPVNPLAVK